MAEEVTIMINANVIISQLMSLKKIMNVTETHKTDQKSAGGGFLIAHFKRYA
jgi:hypothetical protein